MRFAIAAPFTVGAILPMKSWQELQDILAEMVKKSEADGYAIYTRPYNDNVRDIRMYVELYQIPNASEFSDIREAMNPVMERWQSCESRGIYEIVICREIFRLVRI